MTDLLLMRKPAFVLLLLATSLTGFSQNLERYNWYFGNSTQAIRFNRSTTLPSIVPKAVPFGPGGSSTASSPNNANLLFYTDGNNVFDVTNAAMPNGNLLNANPASNQPTAICPVPGSPNLYYIFTNTASFPASGTISVSVVDMTQFGNAPFPTPALGDVTSKNAAVSGGALNNRAEGMIIVPDAGGTNFYLITQVSNSQDFSVTTINNGPPAGFVTINFTLASPVVPTSIANFAYHSGTGRLAASAQDSNTDALILNFDNTTGAITFDRLILNSGLPTASNQSIYDIEFSATGRFLYLSRHGDGTVTPDLLQYDYANPTSTLTSVLPAAVTGSYGVEMAPDSMMYHLYENATGIHLGRLADTDSIAANVIYTPNVLFTTPFTGKQFSNFAPRSQAVLTVDFTFAGTCENNPTSFFPEITPQADSVRWDFNDGNGSTAWSPVHSYAGPQTYNVTLTAFYQDQTQSVTKPVTINAFPLQLELVQDTTGCDYQFPVNPNFDASRRFSVKVKVTGGTASSYSWSNGDTDDTLEPDSAGYYYVVVSDGSGCSAFAGMNLKEYGLQDRRQNIWYFGNKAGIDFNVSPPVALSNSAMDAPEGCAVISDRNGNALFYTDGDKLYDKTDTEIATGIGGDPLASQSAIIVPVPGDETLYYIFTNEAVNGGSTNTVKYSLFDIKPNNGLGALVQQDITLFSRSTERMTASGRWLILHESGNNSFLAFEITPAGIEAPVITAIGADHPTTPLENNEGYMKLGPNNLVAVALSTPGVSNVVELFTLIDSSGVLTNYRRIDLNEPTGQVYGVEFSPGGNKVFATVKVPSPGPSQLFEYFLDSLGNPHFRNQISPAAELGAIQIGPDGNIYVAVNGTGSDFLGTISASDDTTQVSGFLLNGFALAPGTNSRLGLPNFIQNISNSIGGPSIDVTGICLGGPTTFIGTPTDAIDHFFWTLGDGATVIDSATFEHTYALPNTYVVSMRLTNRCNLDTTLTRNVTIFNPPARPTLLGAYALCNGPITLDADNPPSGTPGLVFLWDDATTNQTVLVTDQSIRSVTITDLNGCTSNATTIIGDSRPQLDLGPDLTLCQNSFTSALNAQNPGASYSWTVTGLNNPGASSGQSRALVTTAPTPVGSPDHYQVTVTLVLDPSIPVSCSLTEDLFVTIVATPVFNISGTDTNCGATNGTLQLDVNSSPGPFSYFITGPAGFSQTDFDQVAPPLISYPVPNLAAGTYSIAVQDQVSGCSEFRTFGISTLSFTANAIANAPNCDPVALSITTVGTTIPPGQQLLYRVLDDANQVVDSGAGLPDDPNITTNPITVGNYNGLYTIEITEPGPSACTFNINNFAINPNPPIAITFDTNLCSPTPSVTAILPAPVAPTFSWNLGSGTSTQSITGPGPVFLSVTVTDAGACTTTQDTTVVVDNPVADFVQTDQCQDNIVVTASPTGNYVYIWYRNGSLSSFATGPSVPLSLPDDGDLIEVEAQSLSSGCRSTRAGHNVLITGIVDAGLTATQACEDGQPFTLTAVTSATGTSFAWFRDGTVIPGETAITTTQTLEGRYRVDVSKLVCVTSAALTVTRAPIPVGELPNRVVICNDPENTDPSSSQVDLNPGFFSQYDWFKNELSLGYTAQVLTADSEGLYRVNLTNSFNCVASDEVDVVNDCQPIIVAPNAFRPTSSVDANKNFFVISSFITDDFSIFIFNRWGELVFTSTDKEFQWNGGVNNALNQPAPGGSYSYVIRFVSSYRPERGVQERRGGVALLR